MATANIANTKVVPVETTLKPYYDDFTENKNFHRILFRPGYAVQARELTQLQTILQNQIERFGNHIFKNGSIVLGGQISLDDKSTYINLAPDYAGSSINATSFVGSTVTLSSGNALIRGVVTAAKELTANDPPVIMLKYLTGTEFDNTATIKTASNVRANIASSNHTGYGTTASISDGIFYINGFFVKVPEQTIVVDKYSRTANAKIGLEYTDEIITELTDSSLLDPAQESSNYQAPGAARLQVNFDLAVRSLDSVDDEKFVELLRVENGVIKKQIRYPIYSELGDTMARRTYDESGNYTVNRFRLNVIDHPTDNTKLQLVVDPGKAYIKGYEFESIAQEKLDINKARDSQNVVNQDITINFGNYLFIQDMKGYFDTSTMERVDIHSVPYQFINLTATTGYTSTKVGSARVRELKYYSASNTSNANTIIHTLSIFDTQFANLTSNANVVTSNTMTIFDVTGKFTSNNDAYAGATLKIISGLGAGEAHKISAYTGSTKTLTITDTFLTTPNASSQISIDFNMAPAESIIKNTTYTSSAVNANTNINVLSKSTGTASGDTQMTDVTFNTLVFPFANKFVKPGTINNADYQYMGVSQVTFAASGNTTITLPSSGNELFAGVTDSTGKSAITLSSFQAFKANGERMTLANVTVTNTGTPSATLFDSGGYSGTGYVYYLVNLNAGDKTLQKAKTLTTGNTTNFVGSTADATITSGSTTTTVYLTPGQVSISVPSQVPNEKMSLYVSDVKQITKIYDLAGASPSAGASLSSYADVTSKFAFDNGQRDSHYDHATIALKPRNGTVKGPLLICFDWYEHTNGPGSQDGKGYFSVDSYPNVTTTGYSDIPTYIASDGTEYALRDCLDFRPKRTNASATSPAYTLNGIRVPVSGTSVENNYNFYLARRAQIALTTDSGAPFKIVDGVSAINPVEPRNVKDAMILYKLYLEPYTMSTSNVGVQFVENRRYTMRDIGKLETRIENLEYYQTLSILEKSASSMSIRDANGLERTKYGILADDFTTHGYGDVNNQDYLIAVDRVLAGIQPAQNTTTMSLDVSSRTSTRTLGPATTLTFTEEEFITQNLATKFVPVQPYMISQWVGNITMNPGDDNWVETVKAPDVVINLGENDAIIAANAFSRWAGRRGTRATELRANNVMITEANWWATLFGSNRDNRRK